MFDNLAVLKAEEVGCHKTRIVGRGLDQRVKGDHVPLANHAFDVDAQLGKLSHVPSDESDESIGPVGCQGIMLEYCGPTYFSTAS